MMDDALIAYRMRGCSANLVAGAHLGREPGGSGQFRDHVPFLRCPDARRIDLRASLRDPFGEIYVRRFNQRMSIDVYALVDLSASMGFVGRASKYHLVADFCTLLARSARGYGDAFGLIGFDESVRDDFMFPLARRRGLDVEIGRAFESLAPIGRSAAGLADAARSVAGRRKLVFLVSDFRLRMAKIEEALAALGRHDIAPILVGDSAEEEDLPPWGLIELADLETGRRRKIFMRPSLREKWRAEARARRTRLRRLLMRYGRPPIELADRLDADEMSRHLLEG
ncbi:DUF58 domain-containing protein [Methylocapsa aurea]|uniref:DUF58 domain-containing protein n=1 Tax=Methylocapsa aurea TaxID=663610 RepID=UPI00055B880A|nr:vWA domain-containing protein [Methylocapsa aurea]